MTSVLGMMMPKFSTLTALTTALEPGWLSEQVGCEAVPVSIRLKPDTSILVGYRTAERVVGGADRGWVRLLWPSSVDKALGHREKAQRLGLDAPIRNLTAGELAGGAVQTGSIATDPKLMKTLASTGALGIPGAQVLRYNPARRVVLRYGSKVLRILPGGKQPDWSVHAFLQDILPVPPLVPTEKKGVQALAFVGDRDLSSGQTPEMAAASGALFARLHAATTQLPRELADALPWVNTVGMDQLKVHANLLRHLDPEFADRALALAQRTVPITGDSYLVHGDASPDQVIIGEETTQARYWLTDFDRACLAPAALELGAYLATSEVAVHSAFLEGYWQAGGVPCSEADIRLGVANALSLRLADPLRTASPTWREDIDRNLTYLEGLL